MAAAVLDKARHVTSDIDGKTNAKLYKQHLLILSYRASHIHLCLAENIEPLMNRFGCLVNGSGSASVNNNSG